MNASAHQLAFHGSIILLYGLLMGAPYGRAIVKKAPDHVIAAWRLPHLSLPIGATLMLAMATLLPSFTIAESLKWVMSISLIVSSYSLGFAMTVAALSGQRGLTPKGPMIAKWAYTGNVIGAWSSMISSIVLVYATYCSL